MKDEIKWITHEIGWLEDSIKQLKKDVELVVDFIDEDKMHTDSAYFYSTSSILHDFEEIEDNINLLKDDIEHVKEQADSYDEDMELNENYITYLLHLKTPLLNGFIDSIKKKLFKH